MTDNTIYTIGIYSQTASTKRKRPVVSDAETIFDFHETLASSWPILGSLSTNGDLSLHSGSLADLTDLAEAYQNSPERGGWGAYNQAVAKGIREAVECGGLLTLQEVRN